MAVDQSLLNEVLEQLSEVEDFTYRKMFGGVGFFRDIFMWGAIMGGDFRLKVDASNQAAYEEAGCTPFTMEMKGRKGSMPYWTVPEHVFVDQNLLAEWVELSIDVAIRTKKKKK